MKNALLVVGSAALLVALFLVLRSRGDEENETATTGAVETETATTQATTTTATNPKPLGPARVQIDVRVGNPPKRRKLTLRQGRQLVLVVSADVADEVHVHGYDRTADVAPGKPARIALRATIPGIFEIELEELGLLIAELEVRP